MNRNNILQHWIQAKSFWIALIILSLSMNGLALFFQYVLEEPPCILCIHFRLLFVLITFFAIIGLLVRKNKALRIIALTGILGAFTFMTERAYQTLGTEKGFVSGECSAILNFPDWIAVDRWIPWLFQPMTSCGRTPELFFGITMAEALMAFTIVMTLLMAWSLLAAIRDKS